MALPLAPLVVFSPVVSNPPSSCVDRFPGIIRRCWPWLRSETRSHAGDARSERLDVRGRRRGPVPPGAAAARVRAGPGDPDLLRVRAWFPGIALRGSLRVRLRL